MFTSWFAQRRGAHAVCSAAVYLCYFSSFESVEVFSRSLLVQSAQTSVASLWSTSLLLLVARIQLFVSGVVVRQRQTPGSSSQHPPCPRPCPRPRPRSKNGFLLLLPVPQRLLHVGEAVAADFVAVDQDAHAETQAKAHTQADPDADPHPGAEPRHLTFV
jgi:hypothetical protein